jgi:hypothetical protein
MSLKCNGFILKRTLFSVDLWGIRQQFFNYFIYENNINYFQYLKLVARAGTIKKREW